MLSALARIAHDRPRRVLAAGLAVFAAGIVVGGTVFDVLKPFGFTDPDSESVLVEERFERAMGRSVTPDVIALVELGRPVASPAGRRAVERVVDALESEPAVARTVSYPDSRDPALLSVDGDATYVSGYFAASYQPDDPRTEAAVDRLQERIDPMPNVTLGGIQIAIKQIGETVESDLRRAELLAFPLLLLLSLVVFRSLVAALLPPLVGALAIVTTLLALRGLGEGTDISIFAVNLITGLGLGLAIDYSLFMVSRYREELARSGPGREALARTMRTAGRTVAFSGVTVAAALGALLVFPQRFLYSMGIGGAIVALISALVALTVLPAVLALLGERVNALAPARFRRAAEADARGERGRWYRFSRAVMRRPGAIAIATGAVLIVAGLPFLRSEYRFADAQVLPTDLSGRVVDDALRSDFPPHRTSPLIVQVRAPETNGIDHELQRLGDRIGRLEDVGRVARPQWVGDGLWRIDAVQRVDPYSDAGQRMVEEVRGFSFPHKLAVAGASADLADQKESLAGHLPLALAIIAVATFVLLFLMTGSVVLPIKALVMNLLTVSAAFGILVLVFQDGRLESLLEYESSGALDSSQPILLFAMIFGLSTDYGVFLLTRIKEARDGGATDAEAVAIGLERTGRIVTFAALLFCIAIGAFVTSQVVFIKQVGLGTAAGVIIDATIVRALLVPSLMRLLGRWNWWAPRPLRRLHGRLGLSET